MALLRTPPTSAKVTDRLRNTFLPLRRADFFFWNVLFKVLGQCSRTPLLSVTSGDCYISIRTFS
uniref:Uncharacterized protein n=1 Tax=Anguilla anguilla TaxID=7936 RepID=A0A0E9QED6_ANGAN